MELPKKSWQWRLGTRLLDHNVFLTLCMYRVLQVGCPHAGEGKWAVALKCLIRLGCRLIYTSTVATVNSYCTGQPPLYFDFDMVRESI